MNTSMIDGVQIAAGGHGTRLREDMDRLGFHGLPKHLLPTERGGSETLLGRIVRQAQAAPGLGRVTVFANTANASILREHPDIDADVEIVTDEFDNSLGPFTTHLQATGSLTLGCAGDFYADFSWKDFIADHRSRRFPVSFMVAHTIPVDGGAAFEVAEDGQIVSLRRADRTKTTELVNIGAYIFSPDDMLLKIVTEMSHVDTPAKEDVLVQSLISNGLVGAYQLESAAYNINTIETYTALLQHNER